MRDFESYYAGAQAWAAHADPYSADIWKFEAQIPGVHPARAELLPFIGPPAFLPFWALLARLPFGVAAFAWGCILIACAATIAIVTLRFADSLSIGALLSGAVLFAGFGPFTSDLALGQAALLSFTACIGAAVMMQRSGTICVIWTFFAALQPNIALLLFSQSNRKRAWRTLAAAVLLFAALGVAFGGWARAIPYLAAIRAHGEAERFVLIQMTPSSIAYGFGFPAFLCTALEIAGALLAFIVGASIVRRPHIKPLWKLAVCCALLPFAVPFFHEHDFVVLLLPAILCATMAEGRLWTLAAAGTMLGAIDWLGLAQRPDGLIQSLLLATAVLCALFALGECSWRRLSLPACALVLLAALGMLAHGHAAPVWPDAMRGTGSLAGTAAQIWHDELLRTGQFALNPFWAILRSLTLLGSALLAWAAFATAVRRDQLEMS